MNDNDADTDGPEFFEDVRFLLGAWRWLRETFVIVLCLIIAVVAAIGVVIGELRLADAIILAVLTGTGLLFLAARVRRIYPRAIASGPGSKRGEAPRSR